MIHNKFSRNTIIYLTSEDFHASFDDIYNYALNLDDINDQAELLSALMAVASQYLPIKEWFVLLEEILTFFDYPLPKKSPNLHRDLSIQQLRLLENIGENKVIDVFENLPYKVLEAHELGLKILAQIALFSRIENWEIFKWIALEIVNHSLENGKSEVTAFGCLALAKYMVVKYENVPIAVEYSKIALQEIDKKEDLWLSSRFHTDYAMDILPWAENSDQSFLILEATFETIKNTNDFFQKELIKLRYLQFLVFCGYRIVIASEIVNEKFGGTEVIKMPEVVESLLKLLQLDSITKGNNNEKVIMILDNEPSLYEGTLLHPMLLLLKAVHLSSLSEEEKSQKLQGLRRILDRFKYWAGYSKSVFQCWVYFLEAELRWGNDEIEKSDLLYEKALETISLQQKNLRCLIALRQLSQWFKKEGKSLKTENFFKKTKSLYNEFGDSEAIKELEDRFDILI